MQLTREAVARKLASYLHRETSLDELVAWANPRHDGSRFCRGVLRHHT
jgi:hypothetical protein